MNFSFKIIITALPLKLLCLFQAQFNFRYVCGKNNMQVTEVNSKILN